ncbi:hypothetical protein [Streptomyces sp. NPDC127108]|uniref:hypothetical protein n=1 Tax=Streptomyces sp. NPDC127108 TaxID=3345361 RepID=UPI00362DE6F9
MSSRTRTRGVKAAANARTIRIPRQRGRRQEAFVVVLPDRSPRTRVLNAAGRLLWRHRLAFLPAGLAVLVLVLTAVLHVVAPWTGGVIVVVALLPLLWLTLPASVRQRLAPSHWQRTALKWAAASLAAVVGLWAALAIIFGPLAGPLEVLWFLGVLAAYGARAALRSTTSKEKTD